MSSFQNIKYSIHVISCGLKPVREGKILREIWQNSVRFSSTSLWSSHNIVLSFFFFFFFFFFFHLRSFWKSQQCLIYVYFFIKSVVKWSKNSVRFELFIGIAFQIGQILWDIFLTVWDMAFMYVHVYILRLSYRNLKVLGQIGLCKQCRPRSDAAERGVWSGSTLFAIHTAIL